MKEYKKILVLGGSGGIGRNFIATLSSKFPSSTIYATSRSTSGIEGANKVFKLDVLNRDDWARVAKEIKDTEVNFDLIISTIGVLEVEGYGPEKSLRTVELEKVAEIFQINSISSIMVGKYLLPFLNKKEDSSVVFLSAMVGSIGENEVGGWYSYRASKAALNMMVKNMAIEFARKNIPVKFLLLHPGTTLTSFSKKFLKGVRHRIWEPKETVANLLEIICDYNSFSSGDFRNWDKRVIEW